MPQQAKAQAKSAGPKPPSASQQPQVVIVQPLASQPAQPRVESGRPAKPSRQRSACCAGLWKWMPKFHTGMFVFLLLLVALCGHQGPLLHITRMLGAAASVSESFGELAANIVVRTSALATTFFDSTSTSMDAVTNAWRGIDLTQLEVRQARGRVSADAPEVISLWLTSKAGRIVHQCQDEAVLLFWLSVLESVSTEMPTLQSQRTSLVANGSFVSSAVMVNYLISGHVAFQYDFSHVHFVPRWANPLWEMWDSAVEQESLQIERMLEHVLIAVPQQNITFTPFSTGEVYWTLPELWHVKVARARRLLTHSLQAFSKLGSSGILWGCGMLSGLVVMASFCACLQKWLDWFSKVGLAIHLHLHLPAHLSLEIVLPPMVCH